MKDASSNLTVARLLETYLRDLEAGAPPDREELLARHPDHAEVLGPALESLEFIHGAAQTLKGAKSDAGVGTGEVLGDYRLLRELGRGGMAIVYEAEQVSLGRRVALKVLPFASVLDPKQRQRFKNEALAAAQLRHPHIVPVYAVGCERGVHYYAMQYVEGGSLASAIRDVREGGARDGPKSPLSSHRSHRDAAYVRMAASLGKQAAEALDHAHQIGVVHRDVKPGNLLVDQSGALWVADFGLARSLKDVGLTMSGEILGTVRYMSPEQALAKREPVDHRTDVYSLGATLYEVLTLEPAFPGDDLHVLLDDIASKEPAPPRRLNPAVPVDLETVLLKAMSKNAAARYATAQEMADDLERFLENKPILARRPSFRERAARWARRNRAQVASVAAIMFVATVALAIGAKREEKHTRAALDKAGAALAKAEVNLDLAYRAVNEFLTRAGTGKMEDRPTCTPDLAALFDLALKFYDLYLQERDDPHAWVDKSYILTALGRTEQAVAAADHAIAIDPKLTLGWFAKGTALRVLSKPADALRVLDEAVKLDPKNARVRMQRGVVYRDLGRLDDALAEWDEAVALDPGLAKAHCNRGVVLAARGDHEKALDAYQRAVDAAPNFAMAHHNMSVALAELGRFKPALVSIDRSIAIAPEVASAHLHRGAVLTALKAPEGAFEAVEEALRLDPKFGRAHYNKAVYLERMGKPAEALTELEKAIAYEPGYAPAHSNHGIMLCAFGKYTEALGSFDKALGIDENFVTALCGRGQALGALNRQEEALAAFEHAARVDPKCLPALVNRAGVLNRLGMHGEALEKINLAIAVNERTPIAHLFRCISLYSLGRRQEALAAIDRAIALDEKYSEAHQKRGVCLDSLGRAAEALRAYERAIDLGYRTPELLNQIAWVRAASADEGLRDAAQAVRLAREAVELAPDDPQPRNTLGVALCRVEEWKEALEVFDQSMELANGGSPFDWYFMAIAHSKLGRPDDARVWFEKAVAATDGNDAELARFRAEAAGVLGHPDSRASRPAR